MSNAIGYAMHSSRSADAVIRVYDAAGNVIETHEHKGDFKGVAVPSERQSRHALTTWRLIHPNRLPERPSFATRRGVRLNHHFS
jgi:hypothetical protein